MENETSNQQQAQQQQPVEEKKERIDELDIVGGALVKMVIGIFTKIKIIFPSKSSQ